MPRSGFASATLIACAVVLACGTARAAPGGAAASAADVTTLRIATAAPKGTSWAKIFDQFAKEVAAGTDGRVRVKIYYGSSAGDERAVGERIKAGQLEGTISGGPGCAQVMPSMRVFQIPGLFQDQDEATFVVAELMPTLVDEAKKAGFTLLGVASVGPIVIFSRARIDSMAALARAKLWTWELVEVQNIGLRAMGLSIVAASLTAAQAAFDEGRTDGYFTPPLAALSFQWYADTKYVTDLKMGYLKGCFLVTEDAIAALSAPDRELVMQVATKLIVRVEDDQREKNAALLGSVFPKQGIEVVIPSAKFRADFFAAARAARDKGGDQLAPKVLLDRVSTLLADYRAEHK